MQVSAEGEDIVFRFKPGEHAEALCVGVYIASWFKDPALRAEHEQRLFQLVKEQRKVGGVYEM